MLAKKRKVSDSRSSSSEGSMNNSDNSTRDNSPESDASERPRITATEDIALIALGDDDDDDDDAPLEMSEIPSGSRLSIRPRRDASPSRTANEQRKGTVPPEGPRIPVSQRPDVSDFTTLGVLPAIVSSLSAMSIRKPTPVQAACIPALLAGKDCVGNAKTGQGKTVAFAVPILQQLAKDPYGIFALVVTPTRELAFQISDQFTVIGAPLDIRTTVVVGGMDMTSQMIALNSRPHVVVATPGRLVDLLNESHGEWSLGRVKFLVLDEADRLLGTAFASELTAIFARLPDSRQTCLFTATLTPTIEALALAPPRPGKEKPYVYRDSDTSSIETVETLTQQYILCPSHVREVYLYHLLRNPPESILHLRRNPSDPDSTGIDDVKSRKRSIKAASRGKRPKIKDDDLTPDQPPPTIIFVQKSGTAAYLETMLKRLGFRSTSLHSQLTQQRRLASLGLFRSYFVPILICTDVGARGLDMDNVGMVINWDLPTNPKDMVTIKGDDGQLLQMPADAAPADAVVQDRGESFQSAEETYVHRVGRTARMGRGGIALSFVTERRWDEETIRRIEDKIHTKLTEYPMEEETVLEKLNLVSGAKRLALMELERSEHGKKKELHKKLKEKKQRRSAFQE